MIEVLDECYPVARKAHCCDVCHASITPGTRYRNSRLLWEGSVSTWREHEECARVGADSYDRWLDDGYTHDTVYEHLSQIARADRSPDERIVAARIWPDTDDPTTTSETPT